MEEAVWIKLTEEEVSEALEYESEEGRAIADAIEQVGYRIRSLRQSKGFLKRNVAAQPNGEVDPPVAKEYGDAAEGGEPVPDEAA